MIGKGSASCCRSFSDREHAASWQRWFLFSAVLLLFCFTTGCALYDLEVFLQTEGTATMIESSSDQVILAWDPPSSDAAKYIVNYRIHGQSDWISLGEIAATPAPEFTIQYATLGDGDFDFAITAESSAGEKSSIHMSLDPTAQPATGWFLRWKK